MASGREIPLGRGCTECCAWAHAKPVAIIRTAEVCMRLCCNNYTRNRAQLAVAVKFTVLLTTVPVAVAKGIVRATGKFTAVA